MENIIILTVVISVLFVISKIVEMRFIDKEAKPLKFIVRDAFIVAGCAFVPLWGYFQFKDNLSDWIGIIPTDGGALPVKTPVIFTDSPGF
jgi:hypothetical protein